MKHIYFYFVITLFITNLSYSKSNRKPSNIAISNCSISHTTTATLELTINDKKLRLDKRLNPIEKRILGCEKIAFDSENKFEFYRLQIFAHPPENSKNTFCSLQERLYSKNKNSKILVYQLSKQLEEDIPCDSDKVYNESITTIKAKAKRDKKYIYIDYGLEDPYVTYYEVVNDTSRAKKVKYKGAVKRDFFN